MKQNEKILVFAVTGFLVVILAVAILFGKGGARQPLDPAGGAAGPGGGTVSLEQMMDRMKGQLGAGRAGENAADEDGAGESGALLADGSGAGRPLGDRSLSTNATLPPPTPASLVTEKLGLNRRDHDYRFVRVRPGDTLGELVQTWCGTTDGYLDLARALNEELTVLKVGDEICLPWVDDELVLAAWEARRAGRTAASMPRGDLAGSEPVDATVRPGIESATAKVPAASPASRKHTMQAGETLWKIGERAVGARNVPRFLEQVRALNPGLDLDRLREGQTILLPVSS